MTYNAEAIYRDEVRNTLTMERHERLIEYSNVDVNRTMVLYEDALKGGFTGSLVNANFLNRLLLLTNQGIKVLKNIP